ncbi:TolC family protein [Nibrella viscosa]|uniref:TolC family protein n=1 Tax=Nibrella viscosa TaxID=1084524 RepID=A0ABP8JYG3_9BACT
MQGIFLVIFFVFSSLSVFAQDSLRLTLRQADSLFVRNNLFLLAERFRIDASQAQILQASLYDNPTVTVELSAYNTENRRVLDAGRNGQKIFTVQQLLYTAGKRNKRIALATEAARLTEFEFLDLLRGLRFELRTRFFNVFFQEQTLRRYDIQINTLVGTVDAFEREYQRNNVSLRELLRLKALLFQLHNDRTEILFQMAEDQQAMRTLMAVELPIRPLVNEDRLSRYQIGSLSEENLRERAFRNRADIRASESLTRQAELNFNLQKALASPDIRVGGTYDQAGSYIQNYLGLSASMDLPVFNRNQGNIRVARNQIDYQKRLQEQKYMQVTNEVASTLSKVRDVEQMYRRVDTRFTDQFDQLNRGVIENFQRRNISLLEFIDLFETYNEHIRELNRLKADRIRVYEELTYVIGEDLFN